VRTGPHGAALEGRPGERRASDASYLYDFRQPQATLQQAEGGSFKQSENRLDNGRDSQQVHKLGSSHLYDFRQPRATLEQAESEAEGTLLSALIIYRELLISKTWCNRSKASRLQVTCTSSST